MEYKPTEGVKNYTSISCTEKFLEVKREVQLMMNIPDAHQVF